MDDLHNDNEDRLKETLGSLLQRTRESQDKTLAEAAETTRIHILTLQALEENNFAKLPAEVFVRGFIKLYAKYLGLDPQETLSHFAVQEDINPNEPANELYRRDHLKGEIMAEPLALLKKNGKGITVTLVLAILVLFYVLGIFFKSADHPRTDLTTQEAIDSLISSKPYPVPDQKSAADAPKPEINSTPEPQPGKDLQKAIAEPKEKVVDRQDIPSPAEPTATQEPSEKTTKVKPKPETAKPLATTATQGEQTLPVTVKVSTDPASMSQDTVKTFKYILEAVFEESSQVTVKVDDQPEKRYLSQAGIVRVWKAHTQISLALSNPSFVTLTLNGAPVSENYLSGPAATLQIPGDLPADILP